MKKNVIVSLADSNYFELLNELVDSIKSFQQSKDVAICILDAGLSGEQKKILSKKALRKLKVNIFGPLFFSILFENLALKSNLG